MEELVANIHMHTRYSDGEGSHADIGKAALRAGVDVVIVTDHNVLVNGMEGYYERDQHQVLMLVGEEVHDRTRDPQKNHMLVLGAGREMSMYAAQPQQLLNQARQFEALTFLAHPVDPAMPAVHETDISWVDWQVHGYTGIELWNGFSELKSVAHSQLEAIFYVFFPNLIARNPLPEVIKRWDALIATGARVVVIGGSDAHCLRKSLGPLRRTVFPYEFHFHTINTHLLTPDPLSGNLQADRKMILTALAEGHAFVGYDLPASTRGFRFIAQGQAGSVGMGDVIALQDGITIQIRLPDRRNAC